MTALENNPNNIRCSYRNFSSKFISLFSKAVETVVFELPSLKHDTIFEKRAEKMQQKFKSIVHIIELNKIVFLFQSNIFLFLLLF